MRTACVENVVRRLLIESGLYNLGAGTSYGVVPFGNELYARAGYAWLARGHFPATGVRSHRRATEKIIRIGTNGAIDRLLDGRVPRNPDDLAVFSVILEKLMPDVFGEVALFNLLSQYASLGSVPDSYRVFARFAPSVIVNFNLDGLASECCGTRHLILTPHGTVPTWFGAPETALWLRDAVAMPDRNLPAEIGLAFFADEEERHSPEYSRLLRNVNFVAIIGYRFGRNPDGFDDQKSLERLTSSLRKNPKPIFILDPEPRDLWECIAEMAKTNDVFAVPVYWHFLARAILDPDRRSTSTIADHYLRLLDRGER